MLVMNSMYQVRLLYFLDMEAISFYVVLWLKSVARLLMVLLGCVCYTGQGSATSDDEHLLQVRYGSLGVGVHSF
ncbi:hypothetical protein L2E82_25998 [Cichorium intybus]|uniref:Uncharacterized protein n=1 Tax=Cichorium intybus TaxID=13427 RepID=A0ACB9E5S3_CICIN|nr:hypothetical protein L2E82_25998 [Cichorium intybus]